MNPNEFYQIIRQSLQEGVTLDIKSFIFICLLTLVGGYLGSYIHTKGKNLATKEDISDITHAVESIRTQYAQLLERQKLQYQLSIAALDERLSAHQKAYELWWNLLGNVHNEDENFKKVLECQDWWIKNSLYLSSEARTAFSDAYHAARLHPDLVKDRSNVQAIKDNWEKIRVAGEVIVKSVALPSWGKEYEPVKEDNKNG